jgi:hypothetical protein
MDLSSGFFAQSIEFSRGIWLAFWLGWCLHLTC